MFAARSANGKRVSACVCNSKEVITLTKGRLSKGAAFFIFSFACWGQDPLAVKSQQAKQLMAQGRFTEAASVYEELTKAMPANTGLRMNLGMAQHMAGRDQDAVATFEPLLKIQSIPPALAMCGISYLRLGNASKAVDYLERAVKAMPADLELNAMLAEAAMTADRPAAAAMAWRTLTKAKPTEPRGWLELGRAYEALAEQAYLKLDQKAQGSAYWLALVAETRFKQQQLRSALSLYRDALAKTDRPDWRENVAIIYEKTGHADWAAIERKRIPASAPCVKPTPECHFRSKRFQAAAETAGDIPETLYWRSKAYNELARESFSRLSKFENSPEWHEFLAGLYRSQGKNAESISEWRSALEKRPNDTNLAKELCATLLANKEFAPAEINLRGMLEKSPDQPELLWLLGDALVGQQKMEEALAPLEKAAALAPQVLPVRASLGRALMSANRAAEAAPHLEAALPVDRDGSLHFQLSRALAAQGKTERNAGLLKKSQELRKLGEEAEQSGEITPPKI